MMHHRFAVVASLILAGVATACGGSSTPSESKIAAAPAAAPAAPPQPPALGLYVTNEQSGDLSIIDVDAGKVVGTIPLGKRPRGIVASPDGTKLCWRGAIATRASTKRHSDSRRAVAHSPSLAKRRRTELLVFEYDLARKVCGFFGIML